MAEWIAKMLLGPLISMVKDKASSYLLEQYQVMAGMEDQHAILNRKLLAILDVITEAEEKGTHKEGVRAWLEELKMVAYKANDVFDEFKYEALRREAKKQGRYSILGMDVISLFPAHNSIVFRYRMGKKLCKIVQAVEVLVKEMNDFGFTRLKEAPISKRCRQTDSAISEKEEIVGRDEAKNEIVTWLINHSNKGDLMVLPIVGMGGLGKTTLAQLVFNDPKIGEHFQLRKWVCLSDDFDDNLAKKINVDTKNDHEKAPMNVSDDFDVANLAKKINVDTKSDHEKAPMNDGENTTKNDPGKALKKRTSQRKYDLKTRQQEIIEEAPKELEQEVRGSVPNEEDYGNKNIGKSFLLVLDDVWNHDDLVDKWRKLKTCLQHRGAGTAILATTRDERVAQIIRTVEAHHLSMLRDDVLFGIFRRRAFGSNEQEYNSTLVDVGNQIVRRCCGSPLAAKALGSLLSNKRNEEEWKAVLSKSSICNEETGILPILQLSYDDLPPQMKQCFAFCAIFPKNYKIDVTMLIQLWMANGFIHLETVGKQIFTELDSRSFFQEVKQSEFSHEWCSAYTCKIHDLMHDVALSVMEKECVTVTEKLNEIQLSPNATRHLFMSCDGMEAPLNNFLKKTAPTIQTLLCGGIKAPLNTGPSLQHLSQCRSLRALRLRFEHVLPVRPKQLLHLRYLDLSNNNAIRALPEEISILYNLQTLNLSDCSSLHQLPRNMKYMTGLRHLYTQRCYNLECMPADLGRLTSLQTLTYFAVGASSGCSNLGELRHLNLHGALELHGLENVMEADAKAANLSAKKDLTSLFFMWRDGCKEVADHEKVLGALKPHNELKQLEVISYKGTNYPTWMANHDKLRHLIDLCLVDCKMCEKLPQLWQLPALRTLLLVGLEKLHFLCSGDRNNTTSGVFTKLAILGLRNLKSFEGWWEIQETQGEQLCFPKLEKLAIVQCPELIALPEASGCDDNMACSAFPSLEVLKLEDLPRFKGWGAMEGKQGEVVLFPKLKELRIIRCLELTTLPEGPILEVPFACDDNRACSAFPALKELWLLYLKSFEGWGVMDGRPGEVVIFPKLEKLIIKSCEGLTTLPMAPILVQSSDCDGNRAISVFPELKELKLLDLESFRGWGVMEDRPGQSPTFPLLEDIDINGCSHLTTLPEAPKLRVLRLREGEPRMSSSIARYMASLCTLELTISDGETALLLEHNFLELVDGKEWNFAELKELDLYGCNLLFSVSPQELRIKLWNIFTHLESLKITNCNELIDWPEKELQCLVSLKTLTIYKCNKLTGIGHVKDEEQVMAARSQFLPRLEYLRIQDCENLEEVRNLPPSLKRIDIFQCSIICEIKVLPCLEKLDIRLCDKLQQVTNLPTSLRIMGIFGCRDLHSLSGQLDELEGLRIQECGRLRSLGSCLGDLPSLKFLFLHDCKGLTSLPDVARYLCLEKLVIRYCPRIKTFPKCLKQKLNSLQVKDISDARSSPPDKAKHIKDAPEREVETQRRNKTKDEPERETETQSRNKSKDERRSLCGLTI